MMTGNLSLRTGTPLMWLLYQLLAWIEQNAPELWELILEIFNI